MPRTAEGVALTEQHRQAQLQLRARALLDYTRLWPMWQEDDDDSFLQLLAVTWVLVKAYHGLSASLASSYYRRFRILEGVRGAATPRVAPTLIEGKVLGTLQLVGQQMTRKATRAGQTPAEARTTALVRTSGTVGRFTLQGGRDTVIGSLVEDREARGWARVTDRAPCAFCLLLSARGAVYDVDTAAFEAHDHCGCGVAPVYDGDTPLPQTADNRATYEAAIRAARVAGELERGTSNDRLNAVRRHLADQQPSAR